MSKRALALALVALIASIAAGIFIAQYVGGSRSLEQPSAEESSTAPRPVSVVAPEVSDGQMDASSPARAALSTSQGLFELADFVIVSADDDWTVASYGAAIGVPTLVLNGDVTAEEILTEVRRLGAHTILASGVNSEELGADVVELTSAGPNLLAQVSPDTSYAPAPNDVSQRIASLGTTVYANAPTDVDTGAFEPVTRPDTATGLVVLADGESAAAIANSHGAGAEIVVNAGDLFAMEDTSLITSADTVIALTSQQDENFDWKLAVSRAGIELPGGGFTVFDGKRYIALYGSPVTNALGVLGEQDLESTLARADEYAGQYAALTDDTVVPALEIIVTVASGSAGDDGNYSGEWSIDTFTDMVEAAGEAGQYVVLDFQPGRSDFLSQVRRYEELLAYPHVGVALDPEWRIGPDELPLQRIGHVEIDEVNEVAHYLANFTRDNGLPQKMLILHQFQVQMVRDIDQLDQSRDEIAILVHVDGQGSQPAKAGTWATLLDYASNIEYWGWKNFYDEDTPMLTPEQTYQVEPLPDFVSYQ